MPTTGSGFQLYRCCPWLIKVKCLEFYFTDNGIKIQEGQSSVTHTSQVSGGKAALTTKGKELKGGVTAEHLFSEVSV